MKSVNAVLKGALLVCALLAAVWIGVAQAQFPPDQLPQSSNSRALIQNSWNNEGISGGNQDWCRGYMRNDFPNNGITGPGYYGIVLGQFSSNQKSQHYNSYRISGGEGIWILTPDGKISVTGPRMTSWVKDYVKCMPYDPAKNPEKDWGTRNIYGLLNPASPDFATSNYFPGITTTDIGSIYANQWKPELTPPALIGNYTLSGYIKNTKIPEETVISQWTNSKQGITVTRRVYNWSNPDFDKFYLVDLTFTNTGDFNGDGAEDVAGATKTLDGVYFAFENAEVSGAMENLEGYGWDFWVNDGSNAPDDIYFYSDATNYAGAFKGLGLKTSISRDSDNPASYWDDTGGPFYKARVNTAYDILQTEGQLRAPSTFGFAPIAFRDAGASHTFNDLDKGKYVQPTGEQPIASKWWKVRSKSDFDDLYPENASEAQLRNFMFTPGFMDNPNEANPDDHKMYMYAQVYGPYTLKAGESAKLVFVQAAGHPSQMKGDATQGSGTQDILTWDRSDATVETKQAEMKTLGEQALLENIRLARFAYEANLQVPAAPTNVYIPGDWLTASPNAHQQLSWVDAADRAVNPYYNAADVVGYRVYRSTWFNWGPWEFRDVIAKGQAGATTKGVWTYDAGAGKYTYEDLETAAGFEYHYSVRPYASGHAAWTSGNKSLADIPVARARTNVTKGLESGWGASTSRTYDGDNRRPFMPPTAAADALDRKVIVVPNPYFVDGKHQYPNSRILRFINVPQKSKIYIYSESGDRIETLQVNETVIYGPGGVQIPKTAGKKGERNFSQVTWNLSGEIMTGIFYFCVVDEMPGYEGKTQRGSFVVIK